MPYVNPQILVWARETAGYNLSIAAQKLQLADEAKLAAYENGGKAPSRSMLIKMSKQYHRPLLTFYLEKPPTRADNGEDFRTLPNAIEPAQNAIVEALVRNIKVRQQIIKEALLSEGDQFPLKFVGAYTLDKDVIGLVNLIRDTASIDIHTYRTQKTQKEAFKYLRARIECLGIFTLLAGNLGSHHTNLSTEEFRGFAIADPIAPFIVINDQDTKLAWPVTLLHEVAHIWLGASGISGSIAERQIEKFCDKVASELLISEKELANTFPFESLNDFEQAVKAIDNFANTVKTSSRLIAFRLLERAAISDHTYKKLTKYFHERWQRARKKEKEAGGPSYYTLKRMRLGNALINTSDRLMRSGELSTTQAATVLGVRALKVGNLLLSDQSSKKESL